MLVLTRKDEEYVELYINNKLIANIKITECVKGKCKIMIDAPDHVDIIRPDAIKHTK